MLTTTATTVDDWLVGLTDDARVLAEARALAGSVTRPLVTLSYAQSLDGSLADGQGRSLALSGPQSMHLTHRLRAAHDAILVGIGTVLADNPRLNVRLVEGRNPRPVVLDSRLRIALDCQLLKREHNLPWIFCGQDASSEKASALRDVGAQVLRVAIAADNRLDLDAVLHQLAGLGCATLMVEGGARVITSLLAQRLFDYALITISPVWVGGRRSVDQEVAGRENLNQGRSNQHIPAGILFPALADPLYLPTGADLVVWGRRAERELR